MDQITPINDQNSINNNLSADRKYISISELEFFDCGAANIASTDRFTPKQIVYHARTPPPPPFRRFRDEKKHQFFKQKSLILRPNYIKLHFLKQKAWTLQSCQDFVINYLTRSGMTPVRRTYVVWGLYVNRGSAYVDLGSFSWHILSHQVNSDIIKVSCLMIGCQWDSDDNNIYVILAQPFGIPVHMQGFPSCRKSEQSRGKAYLSSQM